MARGLAWFAAIAVPGILAAPAGADLRLHSASRVGALTATGTDVLYVTAATEPHCQQLVLWRTTTGRRIRFARPAFRCGNGLGYCGSQIATAGGRALWLCAVEGGVDPIHTEYRLYTATAGRPRPTVIRSALANNGGDPIMIGRPDERNLPYAIGNRVIDLNTNRTTRYAWRAPDHQVLFPWNTRQGHVAALAAGSDRVAAAVTYDLGATWTVFVLSPRGARIASFNVGHARVVRYATQGVALDLPTRPQPDYASVPGSSGSKSAISMGRRVFRPDGSLVDVARGAIVYTNRHRIGAIRVSTRKTVVLRSVNGWLGPVSFSGGGLAYTEQNGHDVWWAPWSSLARLIG